MVCVSDTMVKCVYVGCVCVPFLLLSFKLSLGCLFSPHLVKSHGDVQKVTPQVTLYDPHVQQ